MTLILCQNEHTEALQATVSEGLAKGPYVAARVRFKPTTFWMQGTKLIIEPPLPATEPLSPSYKVDQ